METFITQLLVECAQLASLVLPLRQAGATRGSAKGERPFFHFLYCGVSRNSGFAS